MSISLPPVADSAEPGRLTTLARRLAPGLYLQSYPCLAFAGWAGAE